MRKKRNIQYTTIIGLLILLIIQLGYNYRSQQDGPGESIKYEVVDGKKYFPLDLKFPILNEPAKHSDVQWAENYMRLPKWASSYRSCTSEESEVSCYEIVHAAKTIHEYEKKFQRKQLNGDIVINLHEYRLEDKLTILYHGYVIALQRGKYLRLDKSQIDPMIQLPNIFLDVDNYKGPKIITNYSMGCANFNRHDRYIIDNYSWPQALYIHPEIGPFMRDKFSFHAAYFIGNYLFGTNKIEEKCVVPRNTNVVEGWKFLKVYYGFQSVFLYQNTLERCGIKDAALVTNELDSDIENQEYLSVDRINMDSDSSAICELRRLVSGNRLIFTQGSRLGFWGSALKGSRGNGFINPFQTATCYNLTNSQAASLLHSYYTGYNPNHVIEEVQGVNQFLYICGPNSYDVRLYINYLLW